VGPHADSVWRGGGGDEPPKSSGGPLTYRDVCVEAGVDVGTCGRVVAVVDACVADEGETRVEARGVAIEVRTSAVSGDINGSADVSPGVISTSADSRGVGAGSKDVVGRSGGPLTECFKRRSSPRATPCG
jgi:hypothetical protein